MKRFEYYVLNYDHNKKEIINYNIFNNYYVNERANEFLDKYCNLEDKENYISQDFRNKTVYHGFAALCYDIDRIIMYEEWSRVQYEISAGPPFCDDFDKYVKLDCYYQAKPNMEMIVRELIYQYNTKEDINE